MSENRGGGGRGDYDLAKMYAGMTRSLEMDIKLTSEHVDLRKGHVVKMTDDLLTASNSLGLIGKTLPLSESDIVDFQTYMRDHRSLTNTLKRRLGVRTDEEVKTIIEEGTYPSSLDDMVAHYHRIQDKLALLVHRSYDEKSNYPAILRDVAENTKAPPASATSGDDGFDDGGGL